MSDTTFILIAAFGALVQEIIHLYDLRKTLGEETSTFLKSWKYWAITLVMIVVSGIGTWVLYHETLNNDDLNIKSVVFTLGAAFPLIFKKTVGGFVERGGTTPLASLVSPKSFSFADYFK